MKKSLAVVGLTVSTMCAILLGVCTCIVGWRIIALLTKGIINTSLVLEFLVIVVLFGIMIAIIRVLTKYVDVDVTIINTSAPEIKPDSKYYNKDE